MYKYLKYREKWIGLTPEQVQEQIIQIFGKDSGVRCKFVERFRMTEEMIYNYIECLIHEGVVVKSRWG